MGSRTYFAELYQAPVVMQSVLTQIPRCRSCTSTSDWAAMFRSQMKGGNKMAAAPAANSDSDLPVLPADCPPDVERLGNHSWTLLHSISAAYPERANPQQQADMRNFLALFGKLYPCWSCASDFQQWIARPENTPRTEGREGLGQWMCRAHNEVNRKLGKDEFDCSKWQERWKTGWKDGRCDF